MSRTTGGNVIALAPTNNIYTALAGVAVAVAIVALVVLFIRAGDLGVKLF